MASVVIRTRNKKMDFNVLVTIILSIAAIVTIVAFVRSRNHNTSRGRGAQPLTGAGPKPRVNRKVRK